MWPYELTKHYCCRAWIVYQDQEVDWLLPQQVLLKEVFEFLDLPCSMCLLFYIQYCPEVGLCNSGVRVTRMTRRLTCKICRIFITSQLDSKCFKSKMHCPFTKLTHATQKIRVWFYMHPDPVYVTVHVKTYKCRMNTCVRAIKSKRKITVMLCSKRMNSAFVCVRVHILVCSPVFTGECTVFISNAIKCSLYCVLKECSNVFEINAAVWRSKRTHLPNKHSRVFETNAVFSWSKHRTSFWSRSVGHRTR